MATIAEITTSLQKLGFGEKQIGDIEKNKKLTNTWAEVITPLESTPSKLDPKYAPLLEKLVVDTKDKSFANREYIVNAITSERLKSKGQVDSAVKYVRAKAGDVDDAEFDKECGVGIEYTPELIAEEIKKYVDANKDSIIEGRYQTQSVALKKLKDETILKWAAPGEIKSEVDKQYLALLGPKDERDDPKAAKKDKKEKAAKGGAKPNVKPSAEESSALDTTSMFKEGFLAGLHKVGGNAQKNPKRREEHMTATGGKVFTRFPPEPNGYLHIGHSKAIAINFGFARYHGGECYLRYDDTNPEAEEEIYFTKIREIVEWLGFKPYKITHSSDYFDELYELAEKLINVGKGYVCHCSAEEVKKQRGGEERGPRYACPHRERPKEESLEEFRKMRDGFYKPKEAMLRMKQDLEDGNPQMWDLTAYRILDASHHRTGDKWKIYPTYDFTHCLVDSFENITHSLCTTEFVQSRISYDWLCDALDVYRPQQNEYGRLNIQGTVLSKRKIAKLVNEGIVRGWDDPRLFTLVAVRRRGVPPGAVLAFVNNLGVTTANTNIQAARFDQSVRAYLEQTVPRLMMILDPIPVEIENLPEDYLEQIEVPFKQGDAKMGTHKVPFTKTILIDRSDFREVDSPDYFRLAPGKSVGLFKATYPITATRFDKDEATGKVTKVYAHYDNESSNFKKPKAYISWVASSPANNSPIPVTVRLFNRLFKSDDPNQNPAGFLADVNPDSEQVYENAVIETGFEEVRKRAPWPEKEGEDKGHAGPETVRFQAMRVGYFAIDSDTTDDKIVLNRIVTLKEDAGKNA